MSAPTAFPLAWPAGKARTPAHKRERGRFSKQTTRYFGESSYKAKGELTVAAARDRLQGELERLGAKLPVLSTNLELRLDGLPRSGQRKVEDPGVALYFQLRGKPIALACDKYDTVEANIAAIAAHIDAMRTTERHGVGSLEQMFAGFQALPPGTATAEQRGLDWRALLGHPTTLEQAEATYRRLMKEHHPDTGGRDEVAAALNQAISLARSATWPA
jgi:hypothetical protein